MAVAKTSRHKKSPTKRRSSKVSFRPRSFADHVTSFNATTLEAAFFTPQLSTRRNADSFNSQEQETFKRAITRSIADGTYSRLVRIHADMSHDMHTMPGMPAGTQRFLPWHRTYLVKFEQSMRAFEPSFALPYWRWVDASSIPSWLQDFKPAGVTDANGKAIPVTRSPGTNPKAKTLPTSNTINTTVLNNTEYLPFTLALEGAQPPGAHNLVHVWFNGTMSIVPTAPADPMFWLHHAEIDRIWAVWSAKNKGKIPNLSGTPNIMDPWPENASEVLDTTQFPEYPYTYDKLTL